MQKLLLVRLMCLLDFVSNIFLSHYDRLPKLDGAWNIKICDSQQGEMNYFSWSPNDHEFSANGLITSSFPPRHIFKRSSTSSYTCALIVRRLTQFRQEKFHLLPWLFSPFPSNYDLAVEQDTWLVFVSEPLKRGIVSLRKKRSGAR